jgi:murein L,D-transpeptidase YcbB/YkuD
MRDAAKAFVGSVSSHHPVHPVHPVQVFLALTDRLCEKARTKILLAVVLALANSDEAHAAEQSLWLENGRAVAQASEMLSAMRDAEIYGLRPADYAVRISAEDLQAVRSGHADASTRQRFESELSRAAARFVTDVHSGRIDPASAGLSLPRARRTFDVASALQRLASSPDFPTTLASLEPAPLPYRRLKEALAQYRRLAQQAGLTALPPLPSRSLAQGDEYVGAPALRKLLEALGDLAATDTKLRDEQTIDTALVSGIRSFQRRHGLALDGVLGSRTFAAMTQPLEQRVLQLELAMERWRWLTSIERPDIVVNIPQFMLFALPRADQPSSPVLEMQVIVGQSYPHTRTPMFVSAITHVIFQPYWDVPPGILKRELLPRIRKDPSVLDSYHMEIVRGQGDDARVVTPSPAVLDELAAGRLRLRQRPGSDNALGPVKFVMPNPYSVYLHATPEEALFERSQRTFSHGCIRVSKPAALAAYVLRDAAEDWDEAAIEAALCGTTTLRVDLARPVRVVVFYSTAVATQSEGVLFFGDVYGYDRKLQSLLNARSG